MSTNENIYYVMNTDLTEAGGPVSMAGFFNCERFEWDPYEANPQELEIKHKYKLHLTDSNLDINKIDFDFYQIGATYVSQRFLDVCDSLGVKYRAVPLELQVGQKTRRGEFFIFLPGESLAAMDKAKSIYKVSKDIETGKVIDSSLYPCSVSIDKIDLLVISKDIQSDMFRCQETLELFCSQRFFAAARELKGISFLLIDDTYKYDPWSELDDI
ncbi:imm11 family protein [Pseudomonas sp. WHRI 8519]|uniref:imm11 family protein n=1 Tax=Pseudomonas sp. WHRI 8519 TaxID=3162567 RepID=UPI003558E807